MNADLSWDAEIDCLGTNWDNEMEGNNNDARDIEGNAAPDEGNTVRLAPAPTQAPSPVDFQSNTEKRTLKRISEVEYPSCSDGSSWEAIDEKTSGGESDCRSSVVDPQVHDLNGDTDARNLGSMITDDGWSEWE